MIIFGAFQIVLSQIPDFDRLWFLSVLAAVMSFSYASIGLGLAIGKATGMVIQAARAVPAGSAYILLPARSGLDLELSHVASHEDSHVVLCICHVLCCQYHTASAVCDVLNLGRQRTSCRRDYSHLVAEMLHDSGHPRMCRIWLCKTIQVFACLALKLMMLTQCCSSSVTVLICSFCGE